jgi:DNA-directed RNA polymerase subunit E'/Rpb7
MCLCWPVILLPVFWAVSVGHLRAMQSVEQLHLSFLFTSKQLPDDMKNGYDRDKNEWASEDHADVIKKGTVIRVRLLAVTMQHDTIVRKRKLKSRTVWMSCLISVTL